MLSNYFITRIQGALGIFPFLQKSNMYTYTCTHTCSEQERGEGEKGENVFNIKTMDFICLVLSHIYLDITFLSISPPLSCWPPKQWMIFFPTYICKNHPEHFKV